MSDKANPLASVSPRPVITLFPSQEAKQAGQVQVKLQGLTDSSWPC